MSLEHHKNILTRCLPKTGQTISYYSGDDGEHEAGWWRGRLNANNRTRFIAKTIGGDAVVLDRTTGLMWPADSSSNGGFNNATMAWDLACNACNILTFAGFSDWRLPNVLELLSICNYGYASPGPKVYPQFTLANAWYWTSTTYRPTTTNAFAWQPSNGIINYITKSTLYQALAVRGCL